jgi:SAM-dependent methyltransferase
MFHYDERIDPDRYYREHYATFSQYVGRYAFASRFLGPDARVLDIGCGCGYGTTALTEAPGRLVVGLDRAADAVGYARGRYAEHPVTFLRGHAGDLPVRSGTIDGVVGMEMIEHIRDAASVVSEACRVLRPGGVLIVSTPNRLVSGAGDVPDNPYHVKEYTPDEFRALLSKHFPRVAVYGQRLTTPFLTQRENMTRLSHNAALLHNELHAVRSRLLLDERWTGLLWLKRLARWIVRRPAEGGTEFDRGFRHGEYVMSGGADWDIAPYDIDQAPVLVAVCRKPS